MINIICGNDTQASSKYVLSSTKGKKRLKLAENNTKEDFYQAILGTSMFDEPEVIVCDDFLSSKKIAEKDLEKVPKDKNVIIWESSSLTPALAKKLEKIARIQAFKIKSLIFDFLDYLSPNTKEALSLLTKLDTEDTPLIWQVSLRVLLMILYKSGVDRLSASKISGRNILDWQWNKISIQSKKFEMQNLKNLYSGLLKADYMIKSGKTNLDEKSLFVPLILKYLN